jgi:hypothetical protein
MLDCPRALWNMPCWSRFLDDDFSTSFVSRTLKRVRTLQGSGSDISVANGTGSGNGVFVGSGSGEGAGFLVGDSA